MSISNDLQGKDQLAEIGGPTYLQDLWDAAPIATNFRDHAELVRGAATKRDAILAGHEIFHRASHPGESPAEVLEFVEQRLLALLEGQSMTETRHASEIMPEVLDLLDRRRTGGTSGISSGYADVDQLTTGFQPGEVTVIAARPSVGKTAFGVNIGRHVAIDLRIPVLFLSLEQHRIELIERFLLCEGQIDSHRLRTGRIRDDETERFHVAAETLIRSGLYVDDACGQKLAQMSANVRRMKRAKGVGLVLIDYLVPFYFGEFRYGSLKRPWEVRLCIESTA